MHRHVWPRFLVLSVSVVLVALASAPAAAQVRRPAPLPARTASAEEATVVFADAFERTVSSGWGQADTGESWFDYADYLEQSWPEQTVYDHAAWGVDGSVGHILSSDTTDRSVDVGAFIPSVAGTQEILLEGALAGIPTGDYHALFVGLGVGMTIYGDGSIGRQCGPGPTATSVDVTEPFYLRYREDADLNGYGKLWQASSTEPPDWTATWGYPYCSRPQRAGRAGAAVARRAADDGRPARRPADVETQLLSFDLWDWPLESQWQLDLHQVAVSSITIAPPPSEQTFGPAGPGSWGNNPTHEQAEPVNTATGNYTTEVTDLALPGPGLSFAFTRTYNALDASVGPLGPGWTNPYLVRLEPASAGGFRFITERGAQYLYTSDGNGGFAAPPGGFGVLTPAGDGYSMHRRDGIDYLFDGSGALQSETDRHGNALSFGYAAGRLDTVTDAAGRIVSLSYDEEGRLAGLEDPLGRTVAYGYDANGRIAAVTDVRGGTTTHTYDEAGRLATITDQNGHDLVTNTYDEAGRVVEQLDARGNASTFDYVADGTTLTTTMTDQLGNAWTDVYEHGVLAATSDPLGNTTYYAYDDAYNLTALTDPNGYTTSFTYDAAGNVLTRTAPESLGYVESWTYDGANRVTSFTDGRGHTTVFTYDEAGNLIETDFPDATSASATYDARGLPLTTTDQADHTTTFGYDTAGNVTSIGSPLDELTTMTYDAAGRLATRVDPRGNAPAADPADYTASFAYDAADHLVGVTDPLGHETTTSYDAAGNRESMTDPNGHLTGYAYDAANELVSVTDAASGVTAYAYDEAGNLVSRTDQNGHTTSYGYDTAHRLVAESRDEDHVWSYGYDAAGNRISRTDANGNTTSYGYDAAGLLTDIVYADGSTPAVSFGYDGAGNRVWMSDGAGTETYEYDVLDRLTAVSRGDDIFGYAYDAAGNLATRTYPDATLTSYVYDEDGRLASATVGEDATSYTYDAAGNVLTAATPDGITARYAYDRAGRLVEVANTSASGTLSRSSYALDSAGNRLTLSTTRGTTYFTYDALDRLIDACFDGSCADTREPIACLGCVGDPLQGPAATITPDPADVETSWTYDPVGNRLTQTDFAGTTGYTYDTLDRLTAVTAPDESVTAYTYDANGNELTAGADTFAYDLADRMTSASASGASEMYSWSGDGVRLSADDGSDTITFLTDRAFGLPQTALERDGSGATLRRYTYGLGQIAQQSPTETTAYLHQDGLGSVTDLTDPSGTPLAWTDYAPYGAVRSAGVATGAPASPFGFTGQFGDPTGLLHLRARQYDPPTGRFLSTDPASPPLADPYVGSYAYVRNNPAVHSDPSGLCPIVALAVAGGAAGLVEPIGGELAGAAGGALVGFVLCIGEAAGELLIAKAVINQRDGGVMPLPGPPPVITIPLPQPNLMPTNPQTGENQPGPGRKQPSDPKKATAAAATAVALIASLLFGNNGEEPVVLGESRKHR